MELEKKSQFKLDYVEENCIRNAEHGIIERDVASRSPHPHLNVGDHMCPVQPIVIEFTEHHILRGNRVDEWALKKGAGTWGIHQYPVDFRGNGILVFFQKKLVHRYQRQKLFLFLLLYFFRNPRNVGHSMHLPESDAPPLVRAPGLHIHRGVYLHYNRTLVLTQ